MFWECKRKEKLNKATFRLVCVSGVAAAILIACSIYAIGRYGFDIFVAAGFAAAVGVNCWVVANLINMNKSLKRYCDKLSNEDEPAIDTVTKSIIGDTAEYFNRYIYKQIKKVDDMREQMEALKIQTQLSEKQKQNTEAIIHSIRDAVIVADSFGKVSITNKQAAELFGFDLTKAAFKPVENVINNEKVVSLIKNTLMCNVSHRRQELEITGENGEVRYFDCVFSCIADSKNENCGIVGIFHDFTREKEISQMKNDFVSHVSHELKTPLASITAYAEMLVDGEAEDEETRHEFLNIIQSQAQRLNRLIEEILNISRIESGLVKVSKEKISVAVLIKESVDMIRSYAAEKNIEVNEPSNIVFDQVNADRDMVSQVVVNLLSNAVKYTPQSGKIEVKSVVDEITNTIRVTVTDTGVGIPEQDVDHVFDKFYRVSANTKCAKGTGLGLNLVKQIVEKVHGGKVFVESVQGEGSTFGFELPLCSVEETMAKS